MTEVWIVLISVVLVLAATLARLRRVEKRLATLTLVDKQIDFLLKISGVPFDPFAGLSKEIADALRGSETKIEAIKRYREVALAPVARRCAHRRYPRSMSCPSALLKARLQPPGLRQRS
jgi:hypothetical protein